MSDHTDMAEDAAMEIAGETAGVALPVAVDGMRSLVTSKPAQPVLQTAAQAKIDAVAALTLKAYDRASTLALTPEESTALQKAFEDSDFLAGAGGDPNLIYIQHSAIRDRLNSVLGMGQWSLVQHNRWAEQYDYYNKKSNKTEQATRVFVEAMLLVRGCFVAQAVGDHVYYQNDRTNYSDALEAAKTAALRRCCKEFGIGLQAWDRTWCEGWWKRKRGAAAFKPEAKPYVDHPVAEAAAEGAKKPDGERVPVKVIKTFQKTGLTNGKPWTRYGVNLQTQDTHEDVIVGTFDSKVFEAADVLTGQLAMAIIVPSKKPGLYDLVSIEPAQDDLPM